MRLGSRSRFHSTIGDRGSKFAPILGTERTQPLVCEVTGGESLTIVVITNKFVRDERTWKHRKHDSTCGLSRGAGISAAGFHYGSTLPPFGRGSEDRRPDFGAIQCSSNPARRAGWAGMRRNRQPLGYARSGYHAPARPDGKARVNCALAGRQGSATGNGPDHGRRARAFGPARCARSRSSSPTIGPPRPGAGGNLNGVAARQPGRSALILANIFVATNIGATNHIL